MRERDDAELELQLRRVLVGRLGSLPLELDAEALERRRVIRDKARRRRRIIVGLGLAATLALPAGWLAAGAAVPRPSDLSVAVPSPSTTSTPRIEARVGVDHLLYSVDGDIYLADPDGQDPVRIADGAQNGGFWSIAWSPDGRNLSFGGEGSVRVADATGKVVFSTSGCCSTWSPDGSLVAVLVASQSSGGRGRGAGTNPAKIVILRPDGSVRSSVQIGAGGANFLSTGVNIYWTPDGRSVTFTGVTFGPPDDSLGWLFPIEGGNKTRLSINPAERSKTYFSPDGRWLVGNDGQLVVAAAADGSAARPLVRSGSAPATAHWYGTLWSPDGTRIAASASSDRAETLYVIDVKTGTTTTLAENLSVDNKSWLIDAVSWDGRRDRILFRSKEGLSTIGSDGSDRRVVVADGYDGAFQPGGPSR